MKMAKMIKNVKKVYSCCFNKEEQKATRTHRFLQKLICYILKLSLTDDEDANKKYVNNSIRKENKYLVYLVRKLNSKDQYLCQ